MYFRNKNIIRCDARVGNIDERLVGGKAKNLFALRRAGFDVPAWFVVSTGVFDRHIEPVRDEIASLIGGLDFSDQRALDATSARIRSIITSTTIPEDLFARIQRATDAIVPRDTHVAVRSSVVGEDSLQNSFAGLMDSFLNVSREDISETVKAVWASAFTSRALLYRHRKRIDSLCVSAAVIVQAMVRSESSGILFTRDPDSGERTSVISAGLGLGEGAVHDLVETDTYRIAADSQEIIRDIRVKTTQITANSDANGTCQQPVDIESSRKPVLTDYQINLLASAGGRIEKIFGAPQDIEWAFDTTGRMCVLQSRPITFNTQNESPDRISIWDNSNIVESYPGITLPLTFSFIQQCYEVTLRRAALGLMVFKKQFRRELPMFGNMIGLLDGRVYYNLLNWYKMYSFLPGFKRNKESWDQMIGISQKTEFAQSRLSLPNRIASVASVAYKLLFIKRNARVFFRHFDGTYRKYQHLDLSAATEHELARLYHHIEQDFSRRWHLTLYNDFCAMKYYDWLKKLCYRWGPKDAANLHNNLLCGQPDVESVRPIRALVSMAELISKNTDYSALFNLTPEDIRDAMGSEPQYVELKKSLNDYLDAYGDRGLEELKLENQSFRDDPSALIALIQGYIRSGLTVANMEQKEQKVRREAERTVGRTIRAPLRKAIFAFVLRGARRSIACRENMRFARSRLYGIVRRLLGRMAELFAASGVIESPSDLYYLTVDEVLSYIGGGAVTRNLKALVELRKSEYAEFRVSTPRDRIHITGVPYLSSLCADSLVSDGQSHLKGIGCSSGVSNGTAWVVTDPKATPAIDDYILVARSTDPGWVFLMVRSRGIVVEKGSVLSHTAIIGRELGIPTVVGVENATQLIPDGQTITINGSTGEVRCA